MCGVNIDPDIRFNREKQTTELYQEIKIGTENK